ncbi:ATP-binding cassette domain-containing protein, partial [bacterium]|nr:ATP-binding cassette domain-containing protein [bacterium]
AEAKRIPNSDIPKRVDSVIDDCNLNEYVYKPIKSLSKGYKQRVGLAQAIINSPEVLILDEPTVGMDPNQVMEIRGIIKKLGEKSTIVLSSHILEEVAKTCGRVIIMNRGKILAIDTPENLSKQIETSDRIFFELLGDKEKAFNLIKSHKGINKCEYSKRDISEDGCFAIEAYAEKSLDLRTSLLRSLLDNDISVCQMALEKLTLEEIFTQIIAKGEKVTKKEEQVVEVVEKEQVVKAEDIEKKEDKLEENTEKSEKKKKVKKSKKVKKIEEI